MADIRARTVQTVTGQLSVGTKIGITLMVGFIIYLIAVNHLGIYLGIITGSGSAATSAVPSTAAH